MTVQTTFTRFVAIDWSGAKGVRHPGIAVAVVESGGDAPVIVAPPGRFWSREAVLDWLRRQPPGTLAGFDFSFAPPFVARGGYLPGDAVPETARAFWAYVDAVCDDADLGAASFLEQRHRAHFYFGAADGRKADFVNHRVCEAAFNAGGGGKASSVYDAIGAAQVAKASFAGMRLLHQLGDRFAIWPFEAADPARGTVVEIYTRAFLRHAGGRGLKLRDAGALNAALAALGSAPYGGNATLSDHVTDVLVAAAAMRRLHGDLALWAPPGLTPAVAATEGWTFGVY
jgi:hypothetical protein